MSRNKAKLKVVLKAVEGTAADLAGTLGADLHAIVLANLGDGLDILATAARDALAAGDPGVIDRVTDAMMGVLADEPVAPGLTAGEFLVALTRAGASLN